MFAAMANRHGILRDLAGLERQPARELLDQTAGSVKLALLIAATQLDPSAARAALESYGPSLRSTLLALQRSADSQPASPPAF